MNEAPIRRMLDLSTSHMPSGYPDWGDVRVSEHDYGWIVFVDPEHLDEAPRWLRPILDLAVAHDCILIDFDSDGPVFEPLKCWEW